MREILLWLIGAQKLESSDSILWTGIQEAAIKSISNDEVLSRPADILNHLLMCASIEEAELLAATSGGLRTIRALYLSLKLLECLSSSEDLKKFAEMPYPYNYLVEKGKQLDTQHATLQVNLAQELEEDEELEILFDENGEYSE
jgi:hypothetical protein